MVRVSAPVLQAGPVELRGDGPNYVDVGVGAFDVSTGLDRDANTDAETSGVARLELRLGDKFYGIGPAVGILANSQGGVYGYAGVYADIAWRNVVFTPLAAIGGYAHGDGRDLGGPFEFRIAMTVSYELENGARLGIQFAHLSNSGIHETNPGEEELLATYQFPF